MEDFSIGTLFMRILAEVPLIPDVASHVSSMAFLRTYIHMLDSRSTGRCSTNRHLTP